MSPHHSNEESDQQVEESEQDPETPALIHGLLSCELDFLDREFSKGFGAICSWLQTCCHELEACLEHLMIVWLFGQLVVGAWDELQFLDLGGGLLVPLSRSLVADNCVLLS